MPSEQQIEIYKQHRTAQDKYIYFLLAAAGAAITFAVTQTQGLKLSWSQVPLACAASLWALSFFFGCRHLGYVESTLFANAELLKVQAGEHPRVGVHSELIAAASEGIREAIESNSTWAGKYARWQFRCLVLGAMSYLGWHIFEMWLRS
jgi:hypothetical protein